MVIQPEHINAQQPFLGAFGNWETEVSAQWIVRFCQHRHRGWEPFSLEEIEQFYHRHGYVHFQLNQLLRDDQRYLRIAGENTYAVTAEFITRCYQASPLA